MKFGDVFTIGSLVAACANAAAVVQGGCVKSDPGLRWLQSMMSSDSVISCRGQALQQYNANRYWGLQYSRNASVVVFPRCTQDVSYAVQATQRTPLGADFTFVGGAHSNLNASSSDSYVIDLAFMNKTEIIKDYKLPNGNKTTVISYQGGGDWHSVLSVTGGSGYTPVAARDSRVGVGGFSTGGGIGFLAGAYGFATDRLRAMEVVLVNGTVVNATANNQYSDLFWALHGGNGQFGIVTTFYQEAAPEPTDTSIGVYYITPEELGKAQQNTVNFFETNKDPFSLMYYAVGFLPPDLSTTDPSTFAARTILVALRFNDPNNPAQPSYNETFSTLLGGLNFTSQTVYTVPYANATELVDPFFPYGFRRGFYGPQTTKISVPYLNNLTNTMNNYITGLQAKSEFPASTVFVMQYMSPGLNGNLPKSNTDTAWPHAVVGHQTLFSPAWSKAQDDGLEKSTNDNLNQITYDQQAKLGEFIADYPNYMSPGSSATRVFGDNVFRLQNIKQRYDPECQIHIGRTFASPGCIKTGRANFFPDYTNTHPQSPSSSPSAYPPSYGHAGQPSAPPSYSPWGGRTGWGFDWGSGQ